MRQPRRSPEEIKSILSQWEESGKSLRAFAAEAGYGYSTMLAWKKKHGVTGRDELVPVEVLSAGTLVATVTFPNGVSLSIAPGFDGSELQRLVETIRAC